MQLEIENLRHKLAEIGGHLQKLRWEAQDSGSHELASDIANAIEAIAWAAGIYTAGANVVDRRASIVTPAPSEKTGPAHRKTAMG